MFNKVIAFCLLIGSIVLFVIEIFSETGASFSEAMLFIIAWSILMQFGDNENE